MLIAPLRASARAVELRWAVLRKDSAEDPSRIYGGHYEAYELHFSLEELVTRPTLTCCALGMSSACQSFAVQELERLFTNGWILRVANSHHKTMPPRPVLLSNYSTPLI